MKYDIVFIGGGPGGYVGAIRAAKLGLKVALVEKEKVGGTCLIRGCIPTKTLVASSAVLDTIQRAKNFGIKVDGIHIDYRAMKERKDDVVKSLWQGVTFLVKSHGVDLIEGEASFLSPTEIKVLGKENKKLEARSFVIGTGSVSTTLPIAPVDRHKIHDSTSILELTELPKSMVILGAGYIGCEFASLFALLGVKVTMVEFFPGIVWAQGKTVSNFLGRAFEKKGITLHCNVKAEKCDVTEHGVLVHLSNNTKVEADIALVAVGRRPYTEGLNLAATGVGTQNGYISVNDRMQTDVSGIYAIGDVTGKAMLAHVASHQGIVAAENVAGYGSKMDYNAVPAVIFTHPEIATVGYTLEAAQKERFDARSDTFPFSALGKAKAAGDTEGFVEIISEKKTGRILGGCVIGHEASNLIAEVTLAIQNELTLESMAHTIHAHPTLAEGWMEVAHLALDAPLHLPPKQKAGK
ncbi:MAG: dihydrolipoyl dehydrogenase [Verrucomicrobia bacterium]|nr:dihydrolipoyl dehydrogenase [Verrucomicrobiota bacterium]